jgi:sulfide dehydrogenase cytochrome subunit
MNRSIIYAAATSLVLAFSAAGATDVDALMNHCNDCHGPGGVSESSDVPSLAGFPEFVHVDALFIFQDEARPCAVTEYRHGDTSRAPTNMCAIAAELSEDDIDAIAAAYAGLDWVPVEQEFDPDLAAAGQLIHEAKCDRCHSEAGMNPDDEAGMLGGQQMGYLADMLAQYMDGSREQPAKMQENLEGLSDDDLDALVNYYGSMQ